MVVFDDIQWGEETFHDLIEHVALLSSGASILLLCMARPTLTEERATWPVTLRLEPLPEDDVDELIPETPPMTCGSESLAPRAAIRSSSRRWSRWPERRRARSSSRRRCTRCSPPGSTSSSRASDASSSAARSRARSSTAVALQALAPEETQVTPRLAGLVRKELIRPDRPQIAGEDGFRFRHLLIRDAAYEALPKSARADLHQRLAAWLEDHGTELVELDEILGYHLEQAWRIASSSVCPTTPCLPRRQGGA